MPFIQCPECGKEISDRANACPSCGYPISSSTRKQSQNKETDSPTNKSEHHQQKMRLPIIGGIILSVVMILILIFIVIPKNQSLNKSARFNAELKEILLKEISKPDIQIIVKGNYGNEIIFQEYGENELEDIPDDISEIDKVIWKDLTLELFYTVCHKAILKSAELGMSYSGKPEYSGDKLFEEASYQEMVCEYQTENNKYTVIIDENNKPTYKYNGEIVER